MSQRDLPIWARAVAIVLFLFASWWLFDTDSIRNIVGDSVGAACLGAIAFSILQGMRLPVGLWPEGPWRNGFSVPGVIGTAVAIAVLILLARITGSQELLERIDPGTIILVVAGSVALGFGVGFVKQRSMLPWYAAALGLGVTPLVVDFLVRGTNTSGEAGLLPMLASLAAFGTTTAIVTEEIAFRRLLIGVAAGAGLLSVLASTITALCWYAILSMAGIGGPVIIVYGTLGALSAGCFYALSRSLMVSALFSGVFAAGYWGLAISAGPVTGENRADIAPSPALWIIASIIGLALAVALMKKNGFFGNLKEITSSDATRS